MDKKTEKQEERSVIESRSQLSEKIKESARQIWLAGLGAYTKAEEDTGKIFEKLVKEGEEIESLTRGVVEKQFKAVEDTVEGVKGKVEGVKEKATGTFGKLESVFDQRVSKTLIKLGIPTNSRIQELEARIEQLEAKL
ncbi:MAG: poly(hydroxyalkanoate) granule-associated protein [Oleiphilaceae bacterium]|jgi:poly(hydroxyalkanoate) granule-associated protein